MRPKREREKRREKIYIYGTHALAEALEAAPRVVRKVFLAEGVRDQKLRALLQKHAIPSAPLAQGRGTELVGRDAPHQGAIALIDPAPLLYSLDDLLARLDLSKSPAVAVLGEVQDPHNVGAIIRSAAAFGLSAVLIPEHNQAPITGAVIKASAGMVFRIPLVSIGNVNHALGILKKKGFWTYGLAATGVAHPGTEAFDAPTAFVVGNEGAGIRQMTLEACDVKLAIPMHPRAESLNAAVSAAVVFYEWSAKHPESLA